MQSEINSNAWYVACLVIYKTDIRLNIFVLCHAQTPSRAYANGNRLHEQSNIFDREMNSCLEWPLSTELYVSLHLVCMLTSGVGTSPSARKNVEMQYTTMFKLRRDRSYYDGGVSNRTQKINDWVNYGNCCRKTWPYSKLIIVLKTPDAWIAWVVKC